MPDFPVTVRDSYGTPVRIDVDGPEVFIETTATRPPLIFGTEAFEELSQVLIAARHVADQQAVSDG